ncbi:MAG: nucleotidyltransferase [Verrucomicrobiae bacterium]|nr:nucleotidyltransferase [Verrucomicrobiae bacterium]
MKKASFDAVARALNEAQVPFLIVGGVAVIHHGYGRLTQDVDIVIRLEKRVIERAFQALAALGYRPIVPVTATEFADPMLREKWQREKNMQVLRFWSDQHPETPLDLFVAEPFDFEREMAKADVCESGPGITVRIVSLGTLLEMKRAAGRPQDLADIDELNLLHGNPSSYDCTA